MSADLFTPLPCLTCGTPTAPHMEHTGIQCYAAGRLAKIRANRSPEDKARIVQNKVREAREVAEYQDRLAREQYLATMRDVRRGSVPEDWADEDYVTWMRWNTMLDAFSS
jgi:hypothetical protein